MRANQGIARDQRQMGIHFELTRRKDREADAFICLAMGAFSASTLIHELGGWPGRISPHSWPGTAFAIGDNTTWRRAVLPV